MKKYDGKWAREIIALQNEDGTWGKYFHTLSRPVKNRPLTTEQALRRLWVLGYTIKDEPIRKTVDYMTACLRCERKMDDTWEKKHDWGLYTKLMLSTWVKIFEPDNELAHSFAHRWAKVVENAFIHGTYNHENYIKAYTYEFSIKPRGGREIDFITFYHMSLLQGMLTPETERLLLDRVLSDSHGIYYVYSVKAPPESFASNATSWYLAALEIIAGYALAKEKLGFVVDWLNANKDQNGQWDLGAKANDNVYFPLSDSWRNVEDRKADCTCRIMNLLARIR